MKTNHTPGPWKVNYVKFSQVIAENGALVATCSKLNGLSELQANARLIADAPKMANICRRLALLSKALRNGNSSAEEAACCLAEEAASFMSIATRGVSHD